MMLNVGKTSSMYVQYGRTTPCNGDRGTSLMVKEVIKGGDDKR